MKQFSARRLSILVFVLAVAVYAISWWGGFVYDDRAIIVDDSRIQNPTEWHELWSRTWWDNDHEKNMGAWRPLTSFTLALNWWSTPRSAWAFHLFNTLLHGFVSVLVLRLGLSLFGKMPPALIGALLFAVHPVHSEAVANIVGRAELLAALFGLSAWILHRRGKIGWPALLLFLAVLSKESALPLVGVMLLDDLLGRPGQGRPSAKRLFQVWPWLVVAVLVYLALRTQVVGTFRGNPGMHHLAFINPLLAEVVGDEYRLWTGLRMLALHWRVFLMPVNLRSDYSWPGVHLSDGVGEGAVLLAMGWFLALGAVGLLCIRHAPWVSLLLGGWLGLAVLTSNLLFPVGVLFAERLTYLPSVMQCLLVGGVISALALRWPVWSGRSAQAVGLTALVLLGAMSVHRAWLWNEPLRLFRHDLEAEPRSSHLHHVLSIALGWQGQQGEREHCLQAIELSRWPETGEALHSLALRNWNDHLLRMAAEHQDRGELGEMARRLAEMDLNIRRCETLWPDSHLVMSQRGIWLASHGQIGEAEEIFQRLRATHIPQVMCNTARFFLLTGRPEIALSVLQRAEVRYGDFFVVQQMLAECHQALGDEAQAQIHLRRAQMLQTGGQG